MSVSEHETARQNRKKAKAHYHTITLSQPLRLRRYIIAIRRKRNVVIDYNNNYITIYKHVCANDTCTPAGSCVNICPKNTATKGQKKESQNRDSLIAIKNAIT